MLKRILVFAVVAGCAPAPSWAAQAPQSAPAADTVKRDIRDLKYPVVDLKDTAAGTSHDARAVTGRVGDLAVKETPTEVRLDLSADVLFDFDKATIKPAASDALAKVADILRAKARGPVRIEGYTDAKGSAAYNQRLSLRRADAVKKWLTEQGQLPNLSFVTRGGGASNPVAPNTRPDGADNPTGRAQNRRVEIVAGKT